MGPSVTLTGVRKDGHTHARMLILCKMEPVIRSGVTVFRVNPLGKRRQVLPARQRQPTVPGASTGFCETPENLQGKECLCPEVNIIMVFTRGTFGDPNGVRKDGHTHARMLILCKMEPVIRSGVTVFRVNPLGKRRQVLPARQRQPTVPGASTGFCETPENLQGKECLCPEVNIIMGTFVTP